MSDHQICLTRRDFIRGTVGATLAASVLGSPWGSSTAHAARSSAVTVVRDKNVMDAAFTALFSAVDPAERSVKAKL